MRKNDFTRLIDSNDFRELFITYLGWNRWRGNSRLLPIIIEETEYQFQTIADRNGLQVVVAEVDELPNNSLVRKIDNQLRRQAQDYISIYVLRREPKHHLWVVPLKNVDKRDLVSLEYLDAAHADFLFSKIDDIEFSPADVTTIVDVKEAVHRAFFVNSEKITKDFYAGFKKQHAAFAKFITGIDDEIDIKNNRNKQWYASVMLNRLMFCYFIQKKGFLDGNPNYLRDKLRECIEQRGRNQFFSTFYLRFLRRLFSDGLNHPKHDREFERQFGRIPYLNGGMFDQHQIERDYADIDIEDDAFVSLFEFFDKWQWHLDTRVTASGKDINPDVLGYIFEQYINDRAQMGAYYTKEDITEYIGRNTILPFLFDRIANSSKTVEAMFAPDGWVWQTLRDSGDRYLFDAVKQGWTPGWREQIPQDIAVGLDTEVPELLSRRARWNDRTPEPFALPTEIWRETIERLQRVDTIMAKISAGEISSVNDFITYNLDIRLFASDLIAKSDSGSFIYNFYDALRSVTVLDPTCGSGAFLFAAMNILEPLYYECISRLDEFKDNPKVKAALDEITSKYRSNIHYFIYKSIILRNLYGVDLMAEATEIAKLRLFLKMVAVVDVDYRADNLGLDPLPDIDFNIRCGNSLVGYANEKEIEQDLSHASDILQELANQEFKDRIEQEMQTVAATYREFKRLQLVQEEHFAEFKQAKAELQNRLNTLNDTLSRRLFIATKGDPGELMFQPLFEDWLASHHPFHWVAEFYQIIHGNGGFDVIIGNPPYVEYFKKDRVSKLSVHDIYQMKGYSTEDCGNLYAYVIERCVNLSNPFTLQGYIIPSASVCTPRMELLCKIIQHGELWSTLWDERPAKLFDGVDQQLSIHIIRHNASHNSHITRMVHWHTENRPNIFKVINLFSYAPSSRIAEVIPKIQSDIEIAILQKMIGNAIPINNRIAKTANSTPIYYKNAGGRYWRLIKSYPTYYSSEKGSTTSTEKQLFVSSEDKPSIVCSLISNLFYWYWRVVSNCRHLTNREFESYRIPISILNSNSSLLTLFSQYENDLETNKKRVTTNNKNNGEIIQDFYFMKLSKPIIDEIDKVLARHYGFTDEELDFIINYDIKYRMGDELNNDSDE